LIFRYARPFGRFTFHEGNCAADINATLDRAKSHAEACALAELYEECALRSGSDRDHPIKRQPRGRELIESPRFMTLTSAAMPEFPGGPLASDALGMLASDASQSGLLVLRVH
jgi:hypothetical protein